MKKLLVLFFICAAGVIACGKKVMPESDANNQTKSGKSKSATESSRSNTSSNTTPSFNNMERSVPPVPDGTRSVSMEKGKTVFVTKCSNCHALKNPGDYTVDQMNNILKAEIPRAKLTNKEANQVTAYLLANAKK